jgi:CRISPR-associated protein Cas5 subtype I-A
MVLEMNVIVFEVKALFYSYKPPIAYQVKTSNMMPQPSSLIGALYRSYVECHGLDYSKETYDRFLNQIAFAGFAIIPRDGGNTVTIKDFPVLIKHWRIEKDEKLKSDAMLRHYVVSDGRIVGVVGVETEDVKTFIDPVSTIEYLGNSETLVSVRVYGVVKPRKASSVDRREGLDKYYAMQIVSSNAELPSIGVIEQCGKLSDTPWGSRGLSDICYVWEPLEFVGAHKYRPVRAMEVLEYISENLFVIDLEEGFGLAFTTKGFDCLKPRGITASKVEGIAGSKRRGKR